MSLSSLLMLLCLSASQYTGVPLGRPVTVDYDIPDGLAPVPLEETADFSIIGQRGDSITIVPLSLDTLDLPPMQVISDSVTREFPAPMVTVSRTMPDTTWTVQVFSSPVSMRIPPGFPSDYLQRHVFWEKWGPAPSRTWLYVALMAAAAALTALITWFVRKRRPSDETAGPEEKASGLSPVDEALALLQTGAFAQGRWHEYYREVDRLMRDTVSFRFGISNRALTWGQIFRQLSRERGGEKFTGQARELTEEITLQRYAGWGGSRDRARRYTEKLADIRKEWHGK